MTATRSWRSATAVQAGLIAMLVAAVGVGSYSHVAAESPTPTDADTGTVTTGASTGTGETTTTKPEAAPFTTADIGDCLTWNVADDGTISDFEKADCAADHRFEVSAREDLGTYPSSEFGPSAPAPNLTRQAQLREELCKTPTIDYLGGRYTPHGRYSIAPILPPASAWEAGDRTMLCGVQVTDDDGRTMTTRGRAAEQDQSRIFQPGECVSIDAAGAPRAVDCAEPHQLEITAVIDLKPIFPEITPTVADQDAFLKDACTQAARDHLGGDDPFYYSTLDSFWTAIDANAWTGGSNTVNCALFKANAEGGFATLEGAATGPFVIDGVPPEPQPERDPIRQ
ncbi:septum formation family protein [Corynebacterium pygosceleis]|uniref:Septum formation family protein n=1 Tax=Corynebacterium pygosceleis TaxID=2800406 RepID=A0A9Q4CCC3_9CORY|nr:septum formation family protein [Corynebacterium pygosceleis]MCK7638239.1 septum formation family protein [Corynebacterium pygosceleis]MCK7676236.1 septum formation family protein [Corynebacterium pygosceleis]MCL0121605.1 septum formation family protein [Corynebacterium pygosceleis]MCX7445798.1 septum formation family protein [Corynebacterium pygosceleis]MCX7469395.1 septum formation family protein [Corynebacterium pygosceleis]